MEAFLGTWVTVPEKTQNLDAYMNALKLPEDVQNFIREANKNGKATMTQNGDEFLIETNWGTYTEELKFKVGEPFISKPFGSDIKNLFTLEGDVMNGVHEMGEITTTSKRYVKDGELYIKSTYDGVTSTAVMKRV